MIIYVNSVRRLSRRGMNVVYPLEVPDAGLLEYEGHNVLTVACKWEYSSSLDCFFRTDLREDNKFPQKIAEFIAAFEHQTDISSLEDVIKWNEEHAELALPIRKYFLQVLWVLGIDPGASKRATKLNCIFCSIYHTNWAHCPSQ
jgi:hypothetical protein